MTRDKGNEILHLLRAGACDFSAHTITEALRATGDLCPVERKTSACTAVEIDSLPRRVWVSALAGGNSEVRFWHA